MVTNITDEENCNITPLPNLQASYACGQFASPAMDYSGCGVFLGHRQFLPIALANESSDRRGSTRNA